MNFKDLFNDFNLNTAISIDLWPSGQWSEEELNQFINIFDEFGETSGQLSSGSRGGLVQIGIQFISYTLALTFLGALAKKLGDDTYDYLKTKIKNLILKKESNLESLEDFRSSGYLTFGYPDEERGLEFYYTCNYIKEEQLDSFSFITIQFRQFNSYSL